MILSIVCIPPSKPARTGKLTSVLTLVVGCANRLARLQLEKGLV